MADANSRKLKDLLFTLNLEQFVQEATHEHGHTLVLVMCRKEDAIISAPSVCPNAISDHYTITFRIPWHKPQAERKLLTFRKVKDINIEKISADIQASKLVSDPPSDLDDLVQCYNTTLSDILEQHAPLQQKEILHRPHAPWYDNRIKDAKQERRRAERRWKIKTDCRSTDTQGKTENCE